MPTLIKYVKSNDILIARYSSLGINFVNSLFFIKYFGLELFGIFAFYISILKIVSIVGSFGSSLTSTRAFGVSFECKDNDLKQKQSVFASVVLFLSILVAILSASILFMFSFISENDLLWFFMMAIFVSWIEFSVNVFRSNKKYILYYLAGSSLHVSIAICVLIYISSNLNKIADSQIIFSLFISSLIVLMINFYYLFYKSKYYISFVRIGFMVNLFRTDFSAYITSILSTMTGSFEVIIARIFFGDLEAGIARMAFQLFYLITTPIGLVNMESHNLVNSASRDRYKRIYKMMQIKSLKMMLYGFVPFLIYLGILSNELMMQDQIYLLILMIAAYFIEVFIGPSNLFVHLSNRTISIFYGTLISIIIRFFILYCAYYYGAYEIFIIILSVASSNIIVKTITRAKIKL